MTPRPRDKDAYTYRKHRKAVLAQSDICHLCSHPGADTVDHLVPGSRTGTFDHSIDNLLPAHGVNGCPTCGRKCNQIKSNNSRAVFATPAPAGCTPIDGSNRYLRMPGGHGYWDTVCGMHVSERWYDD